MPAGSTAPRAPPAASNVPGARYGAVSWTDSSGNLWLFGGFGYDSTGGSGYLNDLWQYSPSTGQWTWVSGGKRGPMPPGSTARRAPPRPATCRERASAPAPGSTRPATCGCSADLATTQPAASGKLNDLWRIQSEHRAVDLGQWLEQRQCQRGLRHAGHRLGQQRAGSALFGAAPGSTPPATCGCSAGRLRLTGAAGNLNDLWDTVRAPGSGPGSVAASSINASGVYGTQGTAAASNVPGAR